MLGQQLDELPGEEKGQRAESIFIQLQDISGGILKYVRVRPYLLGARKAIEHFGTYSLPEGTIAETLQKKRTRPTVRQYLQEGKFDEAKSLIGYCGGFLQKILDIHENYLTVKKSL